MSSCIFFLFVISVHIRTHKFTDKLTSLHTNSQDNIEFDVDQCAPQLLYVQSRTCLSEFAASKTEDNRVVIYVPDQISPKWLIARAAAAHCHRLRLTRDCSTREDCSLPGAGAEPPPLSSGSLCVIRGSRQLVWVDLARPASQDTFRWDEPGSLVLIRD